MENFNSFGPLREGPRSWRRRGYLDETNCVEISVSHKKSEFNVFTGKKDAGGVWVVVTYGVESHGNGYSSFMCTPMEDRNFRFLGMRMDRFNKPKFEAFAREVLSPETFELLLKTQKDFYETVKKG